jgi:uncharacterized protein
MLTTSAQNQLKKLLETLDISEESLNIIELQGFLHAIVITPDIIKPSEWVPEIFGGQTPEYDSMDQAQETMECLMSAYNHFTDLRSKGRLEFPYKKEKINIDIFDDTIDWSYGFLTGLRLRMDFWLSRIIAKEMGIEDDPVANSVGIILALADVEFDNSEMLKKLERRCSGANAKEELEIKLTSELILTLPTAVETIQEFAGEMDERRKNEMLSERLTRKTKSHKIGRNEPCPCGSGKKYKKCCALNQQDGNLH